MKNIKHRRRLKLVLTVIIMSTSIPLTVSAQHESAEERMNRIYSPHPKAKSGNGTQISTAPKNAPGNMISEKQIYWYYFKNRHVAVGTNREVPFSIDDQDNVLSSYIKDIYNFELSRVDEFERRRMISNIKDEIKAGMATLDYSTQYTKAVLVASMDEYNFKRHSFRFYLRNDRSFLHRFRDFDFLSINLPPGLDFMDVELNETDAERIVKKLSGKDIGNNVIAVQYIKMTPTVIEGKHGSKYLLAIQSKTAFYIKEWENGHWNYGDKIGESEWKSPDPYPHPEIQ